MSTRPFAPSVASSLVLFACAGLASPALAQTPTPTPTPTTTPAPPRAPAHEAAPAAAPTPAPAPAPAPEAFEVPLIEPAWKALASATKEATGLELKFSYTALYFRKSESLGRDEASGADLDIDARWPLLRDPEGQPTGTLVLQAETRHRFTQIPPSNLGREFGSNWSLTDGFNTQDFALVQAFWEQNLLDRAVTIRLGKINQKAHVIRTRVTGDQVSFLNRAFSLNPAALFTPNPLGAVVTVTPSKLWFATVAVMDANSTKTTAGFESLFNDAEFITYAELGLTPTIQGLGKGNYRVTFWHQEARKSRGIGSGEGIALSFDQDLTPGLLAFFNYGINEGELTGTRQLVSGGVGFSRPFGRDKDLAGIGLGWGQPSDRSLRDQKVIETFWRFQLAPSVQFTPDLQVIIDPSRNEADDVVAVFGARLRIYF